MIFLKSQNQLLNKWKEGQSITSTIWLSCTHLVSSLERSYQLGEFFFRELNVTHASVPVLCDVKVQGHDRLLDGAQLTAGHDELEYIPQPGIITETLYHISRITACKLGPYLMCALVKIIRHTEEITPQ